MLGSIWKIRLGLTARDSVVERDGKEFPDVVSVKVSGGINETTRVVVEFLAKSVDVELIEGAVIKHGGP